MYEIFIFCKKFFAGWNFFSVFTTINIICGLLFLLYNYKKQRKRINVHILGYANFFRNKPIKLLDKKYDILKKVLWDSYCSDYNLENQEELKKFFRDKEISPNKNGFGMDYIPGTDVASLFCITSRSTARELNPISSVVEFAWSNLNVKSIKLSRIIIIKEQNSKKEDRREYKRIQNQEVKVTAPFTNSFLDIAVFEVYDPNDLEERIRDDLSAINIQVTVTDVRNKKFYCDINLEVKDGKLEVKPIKWVSRLKVRFRQKIRQTGEKFAEI